MREDMRKSLVLLLILVLAAFFFLKLPGKVSGKKTILPPAAEIAAVPVQKPKFHDRVGEKIIYDVLLGKLRIGTAVFHYQSKSEFNAQSVNLFVFDTILLRFKDNEKIYCDPATFLPLKVEREIFSWPRYEKIIEVYDQEKFTLNIIKTENGKVQETNFKKDAVIHNAILLPYLVRQKAELNPGWNFQANLPAQQFKIELVEINEVKVAAGIFKAYHFTSIPGKFEIWISADEYKIPLKIKGVSGVGYTLSMRKYISGSEI